jgi:hypothetical protein
MISARKTPPARPDRVIEPYRVPGEVGFGFAAELERHMPDGEVGRTQQFQAGGEHVSRIRAAKSIALAMTAT